MSLKRATENVIENLGVSVNVGGGETTGISLKRSEASVIKNLGAAVNVGGADTTGIAQRSEDLTINNLSVDNLDVPPNVNIKNIPRSEDLSITDVVPDIGVPTILRRDGEAQEGSNDGILGLGVAGLKRDNALLTDGDETHGDSFLGNDNLLDLLKRTQETSIGGIGGFDLGTPVADAVNI